MLFRRVPPGECGFTSSDGDPGTNGVTLKTRCGTGNKDEVAKIASGYWGGPVEAIGPIRRRSGQALNRYYLSLDHGVGQFVGIAVPPRKMPGQHLAQIVNRFDNGIRKSLVSKMFIHFRDDGLPK
jgi:hypothetical protein